MLGAQPLAVSPKADLARLAGLSLANPEESSVCGVTSDEADKRHTPVYALALRASERSSSCSMLLTGEYETKSSVTAAFNWRRAN